MKQRQAGSRAVRGAAEGWSLARKAEIRLSSQSVLKSDLYAGNEICYLKQYAK